VEKAFASYQRINKVRQMKKYNKKNQRGFTLIEVLIVIGILAVLAGIVLVAINPARQFAQARNTQRVSNVNTLLNALGQNIAENKGIFNCSGKDIPLVATTIKAPEGVDGIDLYPCLVPQYVAQIVFDPGEGTFTDSENYDTHYQVMKSSEGRITIKAPGAELGETIEATR